MHLITFQVVSQVTSHIANPKKKERKKTLLTPPLTSQTAFKQGGPTQIFLNP